MKKGAIFDMDGVLFDTERLYQKNWRDIAEERNIVLDDSFVTTITGTSGDKMIQVVKSYYQAKDDAEAKEIIRECTDRMRLSLEKNVPVKKGVQEILQFLKENHVKMAIASSTPKEQILKNVQKAGISAYFEAIISGTEVANGKPAPDIFLLAAEKLSLPATNCYVFEDSINGVLSGCAAGCDTMMIPDLIQPSDEIRAKCKCVCEDFFAVMDQIRNEETKK